MQIEQLGEIEGFGCLDVAPFRSRARYAGIGESEISHEFFPSIDFGLFAFDRAKRFGIGQSAVARIQFPPCANKTNGSTTRLKLKAFITRLGKVHVSDAGGKSGPAEMVGSAHRSQLGEIAGRIFGQSGFPTWGRLSDLDEGEGSEGDRPDRWKSPFWRLSLLVLV